jgi:hypothetical protein
MKSGRNEESRTSFQHLVEDLKLHGDVTEIEESVFQIEKGPVFLVAFNSQAYFQKRGHFWFSLHRKKYQRVLNLTDSLILVLICGREGRYFIPFSQVKELISGRTPNRSDKGWDMYVKFDTRDRAYFCIASMRNCLEIDDRQDITSALILPEVLPKTIVNDEEPVTSDSLLEPERRLATTIRTIRDTAQSKRIKHLYNYKCQICGLSITMPKDFPHTGYCEGHHIKPLSSQHKGPDHTSNILALCPNHHAMMDLGVIAINPNTLLILALDPHEPSQNCKLVLKSEHRLNPEFLRYHLEQIYRG